ncbi:S1 family peptidase [Streptomyces sp. MMG1121]|uniref:S1 family peptidase n=1 Tax=Streptomyces sp. MMG1121 TaxID=1415544 RepID=UPI0006AE45AF|nr:serine protease [Streptomyces sp. MMG1121]
MTETARQPDGAVPGPGPATLGAALLRISDAHGGPRGVGFLVTEDLAFTCAHVVSAALGLPEGTRPPAAAEIAVDLPLAQGPQTPGPDAIAPDAVSPSRAAARIAHWVPAEQSGAGDIALLRLTAPLPGARPVRLVEADDTWGHPARAFGFPVGRPGGAWHSGVLRARQAGGWVQADLAASGGYRVSGGFSGSPVWDDRLGGVVGMITVAEAGDPPASYLIPTTTLLAARPDLRTLTLPPSPFRGLAAFREADAALFHGRSTEGAELAEQVPGRRWTCLVGPSGCGKSSLALAGVVPRLRADGFAVAVLRPASGSGPAAALAAVLLPLLEPEFSEAARLAVLPNITALLTRGALPDVVARVLHRQERDRLLIVVDQLEEAYGAGPGLAGELAALLFADRLPDPVHILATLRADFLEAALAHPATGPAVRRGLYALGPLEPGQLRQIVTAPVDATPGVGYESGLVARILTDTGDAPGALPLLGFTLDQLWLRQSGGLLTHRAYEELGGVTGALGRHAGKEWAARVPAADEPTARGLLTALVRVPIGSTAATRRTARRTELGDTRWEIAQRLARSRLLVTGLSPDGTETVELAHEALIGGWPRLAARVAEDRAFLVWRETLRLDLDRWERAGRVPDLLPGPAALTTAEPWLRERPADLSDAERGYLDVGRAHQRARGRRRRTFRSGLALFAALALVFGSLFGYYRHVSAERAAESASRALAEYSAGQADGDPVRSAQLALAAYRTSHTREARDALLRAYLANNFSDRVLTGPQDAPIGAPSITSIVSGDADAVQTSLDGDVVVANSAGGRATVFVHATGGRVLSQRFDVGVQAAHPLVSGDGRRAGFLTLDGGLIWYDVHRDGTDGHLLGAEAHRLPAVSGANGPDREYDGYRAVMSADGRYAAALGDADLLWWDLDAPGGTAHSGWVPAPSGVLTPHDIRFTPDGRTLLVQVSRSIKDGVGYGVLAVDRITGRNRTVVAGKDIQGVSISGDGTAVAVCAQHGTGDSVTLWRQPVADGPAKHRPPGYTERDLYCDAVKAVDTTGRHVAVHEDGWYNLVDLDQRTIAVSAGPPSDAGRMTEYPLLGTVGGQPALIAVGANRVVYGSLSAARRIIPVGPAVLTRDGGKVITILKDGSRIGIVPVGASRPTVRAYRPEPYWKPAQNDLIVFDGGEKHLAERVGSNRVMIRTVADLRPLHEITTAALPGGARGSLSYFFDRSRSLITVSGTVIQRWNPSDGRQLARYDAKNLHPSWTNGAPNLVVADYPTPGRVAITVWDQRQVRIVALSTGRTQSTLATGPDTNTVNFTRDDRYFALLRLGGAVELWQRDPLRRVLGPVGLGEFDAKFALSYPSRSTFLLASHGLIHLYRLGDPAGEDDVYNLGPAPPQNTPYTFEAASADGRTVIYTDSDGHSAPLRLDPDAWRRALCGVIGYRELTAEERSGLPVKVPDGSLCPDPHSGTTAPDPGRPELM